MSVVFGLGYATPPPLVLLILTMMIGAGASIGTQVLGIFVFILVILAIVEIALVGHLLAPRATESVLGPVHTWALAHRTTILLVIFLVAGLLQAAIGVGIL